MTKPLEGLKVLELGQLIAGPFAGKFFAEFGAEVIKIEPPEGGDPLRQWRKLHQGTSLWWYVQNAQQAIGDHQPAHCPKARRSCGGWRATPTW